MARYQYYSDPSTKHLEVYYDFSGGLNTVTSNDNLGNDELSDLANMDLGTRGSLKRRNGMVRHLTASVEGKAQGYFRFYKDDGVVEEIIAVSGKLYKDGAELPILNLASFQTERPIEAVQFGKIMFFATGSKLVQYDGSVAKVVEPYAPQPLEAMYIGTNGLADDPDNYIQDGVATFLRIDGVTVTMRYGVVNVANTFEVFVSKPEGSVIEYQFKYRKKGAETWVTGQDWSTDKKYVFTPTETIDYELDVYARVQGETDPNKYGRYILPSYKVKETNENEQVDATTIQTCNRILLHWNRLVLYGDTEQPQAIYVSEVNRGDYFPIPNSLLFDNERREGVTALVRFRDFIVAFTPTSIQALHGKYPAEFQRSMLSTGIGCVAPYSAQVMGNYITFLSKEGVYILKSLGYTESRVNVEKIDNKIDNIVNIQEDACGFSLHGQYHLVLPQEKKRLRYYYELPKRPWTKDESEKLNFVRMYEFEGVLYGQAETGHVLKFEEEVWDDDGYVYQDIVETKYFDFGQPYSPKKLKELQLLLAHQVTNVNSQLYVYADAAEVVKPDADYASIDENGNVAWNLNKVPNVEVLAGTVFGAWEIGSSSFGNVESSVKKVRLSGKCRRTKMRMIHEEATPNHLLGLAYIFKQKKP